MPSATSDGARGPWSRNRGLLVPSLLAASILVVVVPLPAWLLDLLLAANLAVSVLVLLTAVYVRKPLDFSAFPSLLLGTTLARLVLNVASTRLILTRAHLDGAGAAGGVIEAFGEFVAGGQVAVGVILFAILAAIQFFVITKGATRISEVAARFALDGMPGRQMAIDADVQAGLLTAEAARRRREEVTRQADFYGAMDGAGKFVRGDAVAGIVILLINIVGGLFIGLAEHGMALGEALQIFTRLTIGDGLVTQVPAFLISLGAGLLITRSSVESDLPDEMVGQMFVGPQALGVAAAFLTLLAFTGLPRTPLLSLSAGLAMLAWTMSRRGARPDAAGPALDRDKPPQSKPAHSLESKLHVEPLTLELGFGLIRLADPAAGGDLAERISRMRGQLAEELGLVLPGVRIRDSLQLDQRQYQVRLSDAVIAGGEVYPQGLLAVETGVGGGPLPGVRAEEPATGREAVWIEPAARERAERLGRRVLEPAAVVAEHLTDIVRRHSAELLSREQVHQLLDHLRQRSPRVIDELIPNLLRPAQVHQVLCRLLRERVPIRNLESILETLGDHADQTRDVDRLTELVRQSLCRVLCQQYRDRRRVLRVAVLDPALEDRLSAALDVEQRGPRARLAPGDQEALLEDLGQAVRAMTAAGLPPVLLVSPGLRPIVRQLTAAELPRLAVLSLAEISPDTRVETVEWVADGRSAMADQAELLTH